MGGWTGGWTGGRRRAINPMMPFKGNYEGSDGKRRRKRSAYNFETNPSAKWQSPITLHLSFDNSGSYMDNIRAAAKLIEDSTCLEFIFSTNPSATPPTTPHISFKFHSEGCVSFVGKSDKIASPIIGDEQCYSKPGNLLHLLVQTLGLWHQTQRLDRDYYVDLVPENLQAAHKADFHSINQAFVVTLGLPYDYASVTHLSAQAHSSNGQPTIIPSYREYILTMGQRVELSFLDAKLLNKLYCSDECPSQLSCANGGYQDPGKCDACVCPEGFEGLNCTLGASQSTVLETGDCGGVLEAQTTPSSIHSPGYDVGSYPGDVECTWLIKAAGKVEMKFEGDFQVYADEESVCQHWVEVRYKNPLNATGPRFCGASAPSEAITSLTSDVIVVFKSLNVGQTIPQQKGFKLTYKLVDREPCLKAPCQNEGECLSLNEEYKCRCAQDYAGDNCEIHLPTSPNQCDHDPCLHNGTCVQLNNTAYSCQCLSNFFGNRCENAHCGGCMALQGSRGCRQRPCQIGFDPPRNCTKSRYRWYRRYRGGYNYVKYNVTYECVKETMCCENAVKLHNRCSALGWTSFSGCSRRCGGGMKTRLQYAMKKNEYMVIGRETKKCNEEPCQTERCSWYYRWSRYC